MGIRVLLADHASESRADTLSSEVHDADWLQGALRSIAVDGLYSSAGGCEGVARCMIVRLGRAGRVGEDWYQVWASYTVHDDNAELMRAYTRWGTASVRRNDSGAWVVEEWKDTGGIP